jgi:hypothetical protein
MVDKSKGCRSSRCSSPCVAETWLGMQLSRPSGCVGTKGLVAFRKEGNVADADVAALEKIWK